ncbi:hypothetical protein H632_c4166p0, partial [Helicosporidium sp. ATCC 50920]
PASHPAGLRRARAPRGQGHPPAGSPAVPGRSGDDPPGSPRAGRDAALADGAVRQPALSHALPGLGGGRRGGARARGGGDAAGRRLQGDCVHERRDRGEQFGDQGRGGLLRRQEAPHDHAADGAQVRARLDAAPAGQRLGGHLPSRRARRSRGFERAQIGPAPGHGAGLHDGREQRDRRGATHPRGLRPGALCGRPLPHRRRPSCRQGGLGRGALQDRPPVALGAQAVRSKGRGRAL